MLVFLLGGLCGFVGAILVLFIYVSVRWEVIRKMNKEDILLLVSYFRGKTLDEEMTKLQNKLELIKKQIEAQDVIQEVQKKLAEMDKTDK